MPFARNWGEKRDFLPEGQLQGELSRARDGGPSAPEAQTAIAGVSSWTILSFLQKQEEFLLLTRTLFPGARQFACSLRVPIIHPAGSR